MESKRTSQKGRTKGNMICKKCIHCKNYNKLNQGNKFHHGIFIFTVNQFYCHVADLAFGGCQNSEMNLWCRHPLEINLIQRLDKWKQHNLQITTVSLQYRYVTTRTIWSHIILANIMTFFHKQTKAGKQVLLFYKDLRCSIKIFICRKISPVLYDKTLPILGIQGLPK